MSIPDEVVERVARAICDAHENCWDDLRDDARRNYMDDARAALSASRWMEMREALDMIALATPDSEPPFRSMGEGLMASRIMRDIARAALKAGDKT